MCLNRARSVCLYVTFLDYKLDENRSYVFLGNLFFFFRILKTRSRVGWNIKKCDWFLLMNYLIKFTQESIDILKRKIAFALLLPS